MNQLIERYIYDVTRRLSEKDRIEVSRELEANIMDMLPGDATEHQVTETLTRLGDPRIMAEQYRAKPRYLISPAMFDTYLSVLKMVVPIVAAVLACISAFATIFDVGASFSFITLFSNMTGSAMLGALQATTWVTLGFAIADYANLGKRAWTVADLPMKPNLKEVQISLASSIGEIIGTIFFTVLVVMMILRNESFLVFIRNTVDSTEMINPFTNEALLRLIPFIIITGVISIAVTSFKLYYGRWTMPLLIINTAYNCIWVGIVIYVINWPDLFNPEFKSVITPHLSDSEFLMRIIESDHNGFRIAFAAIMIFIALMDMAVSAVNTWKGSRKSF